jgi:hypothetical protein
MIAGAKKVVLYLVVSKSKEVFKKWSIFKRLGSYFGVSLSKYEEM